MAEILVAALPLFALLGALLLGRYPGCDAIVRLSERIRSRRFRPGASPRHRGPRAARSQAPRGGLLLALSLSGRAPPAPASS